MLWVMRKPKWIASERTERIGRFHLDGKAGDIYPLLCPVREYEWLPGWSCTMAYAVSGAAEKDAVFHTVEAFGKKAVWTLITFQPDLLVEYLIVSGRNAVVRLSISLAENTKSGTDVTWRMLFTTTSFLGKEMVGHAFSEERFHRMMKRREAELGHFLKTGTMIGE